MNGLQHKNDPSALDSLFEQTVLDLGIPPCPAILTRFMDEAQKDEPDYQRLATIISADVSLSASLIKTANSPFFGVRQRVRSINEALMLLGLNIASRAVAGIILRKSFPAELNLERFWDASARFARLSGWLVQQLAIPRMMSEDAYTFGLFRDCGIPVLLGRFPAYHGVLESANHEAELMFTEVEEGMLPTNHAMVGCVLAQSWWLPEELCLAIRHHHERSALDLSSPGLPLLSRKLIAVTQLAEHLVQQHSGLSFTQEWGKLGVACMQLLEVDEARLQALYTEAAPIILAEE